MSQNTWDQVIYREHTFITSVMESGKQKSRCQLGQSSGGAHCLLPGWSPLQGGIPWAMWWKAEGHERMPTWWKAKGHMNTLPLSSPFIKVSNPIHKGRAFMAWPPIKGITSSYNHIGHTCILEGTALLVVFPTTLSKAPEFQLIALSEMNLIRWIFYYQKLKR